MRRIVGDIDFEIVTVNARVYEYQVDAFQLQNINLFIQELLYGELLDNQGGQLTNRWWLNAGLEVAFEDGTSDALQSAKNVTVEAVVGDDVSQAIRVINLEQVLLSQPYQRRIGLLKSRVFESMKGLADSTRSDLADTLARGMAAGTGVRQLTKDVIDRVGISSRRAERIVRTEILNSYRTATAAETDDLNETVYDDAGWELTQLWFSALAPTTRAHHASRHGQIYTTQETRDFYSVNANAINCLCSQSPVLANKKTGKILQEKLQKRLVRQREAFAGSL